jgi:hypothetical protein
MAEPAYVAIKPRLSNFALEHRDTFVKEVEYRLHSGKIPL